MTLQPQDPEHRRVAGGDGSPIVDTSSKKFDVKLFSQGNITSIGANNGRPM